jgi:putative hemin transport protein
MTPAEIRAALAQNPGLRPRDLADSLGIAEAQLLAARLGAGVTRIAATPDRLMPLIEPLGEVMALTRNHACVAERVGVYRGYQPGVDAAMLVGAEIDLRLFPRHWCHAFAVAEPGQAGVKRSIQIFDAAGDAVHKIHLRDGSNIDAFDALVAQLSLAAQSCEPGLGARGVAEPARISSENLGQLRQQWDAMRDSHQLLRLINRLGANRLGAYRALGAPYARDLPQDAVTRLLQGAAEHTVGLMIYVGNVGCMQIFGGKVKRIVAMGPWINILDPGHDMHLRSDKVAEVWGVIKPGRGGSVVSVEAFDAEGALIVQIFGQRAPEVSVEGWECLMETLFP